MADEEKKLFTIDNLTVSYEHHPVLHHVSFGIAEGALVAITGPNGGGKSTLLKILAGIMRHTEGEITWHPAQAKGWQTPRRIAWLPQLTPMMRQFPLTVEEVVALGHWPTISWHGKITAALRDQAQSALAQVGLQGFERRTIDNLSVGQTQRMLFARLILADADLILLDEPFAALDVTSTKALLGLIGAWHRQGRTVLVVLHDHTQVKAHFPECLLLARRLIAQGTPDQVLTETHLSEAQTMLEAWDEFSEICDSPTNTSSEVIRKN